MKRRLGCIGMTILLLGMTLMAGCNRDGGQNVSTQNQSEGETTITWWAFPVFSQNDGENAGDYEQSLIEAFEKKNPGIHVELQMLDYTTGPEKLENAIANNNAPDVLKEWFAIMQFFR